MAFFYSFQKNFLRKIENVCSGVCNNITNLFHMFRNATNCDTFFVRVARVLGALNGALFVEQTI